MFKYKIPKLLGKNLLGQAIKLTRNFGSSVFFKSG